jgi:dephospho-CoA kinase
VRQRNEKADDNVSFAKFKKMHLAENEKYVCEIGKKADYVVDNNGTFVDFRRKIDEVMKKIKN